MSTANKLTYLNGTKQAIKNAINEDFEVIDNNTTFREYADEISSNNASYKALIPKETKSATSTLDISNSAGLDKALVTQYGNTYQETTTGKNLFDKNNANILNAYFNASQTTIANNDANRMIYIPCEPNTTYTISKIRSAQFNIGYTKELPTSNVQVYDINTSPTFYDNNKYYYFTITTGADAEYIVSRIYQTAQDTTITLNEVLASIQVEKSSTVTSYEKYTGGNPAPNPDYPQTISNVTGTNTIKICGKNLFDGVLELGNYNSTTGEKLANNNYIINTNLIPVNELTNYKISLNGNGIGMYVFEYKSDYSYNLTTRKTIDANSYLTTNSGTKYIAFRTIDVNTDTTSKIQVEKGTTATSYEVFKEQSYTINLGDIELCKIDTYKDRIYPLNGKWYLEKKIGKVVLNGTQTLFKVTTGTTGYYRFNVDIGENIFTTDSTTAVAPIYCNRLVGVTRGNTYNRIEGIAPTTTSYSYNTFDLYIEAISQMTVEQANTWFSNNPTIVYYPYKQPTTEEITENNYPTLYNQLNNIKLFEGVNHLTFTNESGLDVEFDIEYYKDWKLD